MKDLKQPLKKFTGTFNADEWLIESDTGYVPLKSVSETIPYQEVHLKFTHGRGIFVADTHIVFDADMNQVFVKDLLPGDQIQSKDGLITVTEVQYTENTVPMYDVEVDNDDHRYYADDILSHNTTTAAGYLLWYAMFHSDQTILVAAHIFAGAQEIMSRVRYAYESCPNFIRAGATNYNRGSIEFENGSRIVSTTTTENTGRGMSISLLYCLEDKTTVQVRSKLTGKIETISLIDLHRRLYAKQSHATIN